jgi:RimJ/RimL family protein N-acetyltransferase
VFELAVFGGRRPLAGTEAHAIHATAPVPSLPPTLHTERLLLRAPRIEDADAIYHGWATDPECTRYLTWQPHTSVQQTVDFLQRVVAGVVHRGGGKLQAAEADSEMGQPWVLTTREDGTIIGMIDLRLRGQTADLGYVLARRAWGKGYATEAARAVIDAAFALLPQVYRVWATCDVDNPASARVMEKASMQREGMLRRYVVHPNISPEPRDAYMYAKTR